MKKAVVIIIVLAVAAIVTAAAFIFYFNEQNIFSTNPTGNSPLPSLSGNSGQINDEQPQKKLVTDDFEIVLPAGWQKTTPAIGSSAMAVKADEQLNNPAAQKINFRSYFAVSYDTLQGKDMGEYMQTLKGQLRQTISNVVFLQERDTVINNMMTMSFEADLTQQGTEFKVLMVVVKGADDDVWVISFNTLPEFWASYQEAFSNIANSFKLKLKNQ